MKPDSWSLRPGVTYLNHGSFGPAPREVLARRQEWLELIESEPMDFFIRRHEEHLDQAREKLGQFVGTPGRNLVLVDNATFAMNIVARTVPLAPGGQILATDHEYGAVLRLWRERCREAGAELVVARLPARFESADEVLEAIFSAATAKTRLLVVSHITSPTAVILPVQAICSRARELGITVAIDGPHALAAVPVEIDRLGCDFYTASCHKWLCAPFGSGFLFVHPRWQQRAQPGIVSWGRSLGGRPANWIDEFHWSGTRDPSACLSVPAAIEFFERPCEPSSSQAPLPADSEVALTHATRAGEAPVLRRIDLFRAYAHSLVRLARERLTAMTGLEPLVPDSAEWYGTMIALPLPESVSTAVDGHYHPLQQALWERYGIEAPIVAWHGRRLVRVSCHLYNDAGDIDLLAKALKELL